jgi:hypothetical protein
LGDGGSFRAARQAPSQTDSQMTEKPLLRPTPPETRQDAPQVAKSATAVPIRSGPCRVLWLSHDWSGPRGQCGRCGQERG